MDSDDFIIRVSKMNGRREDGDCDDLDTRLISDQRVLRGLLNSLELCALNEWNG
jgi:hypothetical protein